MKMYENNLKRVRVVMQITKVTFFRNRSVEEQVLLLKVHIRQKMWSVKVKNDLINSYYMN